MNQKFQFQSFFHFDDTVSSHEILKCIETVLITSSYCLICVRNVLGILDGADSSVCDPAKIAGHYHAKKMFKISNEN